MSNISLEMCTGRVRRWEVAVEVRTVKVGVYREKMQTFATALARSAVMGDPLVSPMADVERTWRFLLEAERELQRAENRLAYYQGRLLILSGVM